MLTLTACTVSQGPRPEEVLKRVATAGQTLRSAHFSADGTVQFADGNTIAFSLLNGVLQDGGRKISMTASLLDTQQSLSSGSAMDIIMRSPCDIYRRPHSEGQEMISRWIKSSCSTADTQKAIIDPQFLGMQMDAITVVRDRGVVVEEGQALYHYDIALNQTKLQEYIQSLPGGEGAADDRVQAILKGNTVNGEVWINTSLYRVQRLAWNIAPKAGQKGTAVHFSVRFWDFDVAPDIPLPTDSIAPPLSDGNIDPLLHLFNTAGNGSAF